MSEAETRCAWPEATATSHTSSCHQSARFEMYAIHRPSGDHMGLKRLSSASAAPVVSRRGAVDPAASTSQMSWKPDAVE